MDQFAVTTETLLGVATPWTLVPELPALDVDAVLLAAEQPASAAARAITLPITKILMRPMLDAMRVSL